MIEVSSGGRRSRWPIGLFGMLAIVVGIERYIASRDVDLGTMYSIEWRDGGRSVAKNAKDADVLCFGTSMSRLGVSPKAIEERLGLSAYNFALSGAQPFATYTMLRHALAAGAKPKAIVVDFKWSTLGHSYTFNERVLPEMASVAEWTELAIATRDPEFFGRLALVSTLPSYACRPEIRANVVAAIDGREPVRNGQHWAVKRNTKQNRGATLFGATGKPAEAFNPDEPSLFPKDWTGDAVSRGFLEKFLALAESRQVPVFWLVPPIMPKAQAHRSAVGAEARYTRFIEETAARFRNVTVVDARSSAYAPEAFNDTTHLNLDGAVVMSGDLGSIMADVLNRPVGTRPGWVSLPAYRRDPDAQRFEDIGESIARVAEHGAGRLSR